MANESLSFPPLAAPLVDPNSGVITQQWAMWFQQMFVRIGGTTPIDPNIPITALASSYARNTYIDSTGTITGTVGGLIFFYRSGLGLTTVLNNFTATNTAAVTVYLNAWNVPYGQIPSASNQILGQWNNGTPLGQPVSPSATVSFTEFFNQELGSGAGIVLLASVPGVLLCSMTGRILS